MPSIKVTLLLSVIWVTFTLLAIALWSKIDSLRTEKAIEAAFLLGTRYHELRSESGDWPSGSQVEYQEYYKFVDSSDGQEVRVDQFEISGNTTISVYVGSRDTSISIGFQ